jgi:hypothetical protein
MHVGLQHVSVDLDLERRGRARRLAHKHLPAGGGHEDIDFLEERGIHEGDVVAERLAAEALGVGPPRVGADQEHLAQEQIIVGQVFHPVPVGVQPQADHAEHQDLPQVHAGASGRLFVRHEASFQQGEDGCFVGGMSPDPPQARQEGRQFVAAVKREQDLLDGSELQVRLRVESLTHKIVLAL